MGYVSCLAFYTFLLLFANTFIAMDWPCKDIPGVNNFNFSAYLGKWYEIARSRIRDDEYGQVCVQWQLWDTRGDIWPVTRLYRTIRFFVEYNDTRNWKIDKKIGQGITADGYSFRIIDIDYDKYVVTYSCKKSERGLYGIDEITWINSREPTLADSIAFNITKLLGVDGYNLIQTRYIPINQTDCPEYGERRRRRQARKQAERALRGLVE